MSLGLSVASHSDREGWRLNGAVLWQTCSGARAEQMIGINITEKQHLPFYPKRKRSGLK